MLKNYTIKLFSIAFFAILSLQGFSQDAYSFFDDFESYAPGDYLAKSSPVWTTWSGTEGGQEDALISDAQFSSDSNSVHLMSTAANGGPTDLVFPMPQLYENGTLIYESNFFVDEGQGGYFNFQGGAQIGQLWTLDIYFVNTGNLFVTQSANSIISVQSTFPIAEWFNFKITADMTINSWTVELNGEVIGVFSTEVNKISSFDFFPNNGTGVGGNGLSSFYMDDFKVDYIPFEPLQNDGALLAVDALTLGLTGDVSNISGEIINVGVDTITSFDVNWSYGAGTMSGTQSVSGVSLATLDKYTFDFDDTFVLEEGDVDLTLEIVSVNGANDDNADNNSKLITTKAVTPALNKLYVGEELTGTWCGWCPRGAVALDYMTNKYPEYFQGIAVHGGDPMQNDDYLAGIVATLNGISGENPGYPSLSSMRNAEMDPGAVETAFLEQIQITPAATMISGAAYNDDTRLLQVSVSTSFISDNSDNYNVSVVLVENNVTGTGSDWNQTNYYSFQSQNIPLVGAGHDWQAEPSSVPASDMIYNDVSRVALGGYAGVKLEESHIVGTDEVKNFLYTVPADYDMSEMHFVALLLNADGSINNSSSATFEKALANGFVEVLENIAYHDIVINEFVADNDSLDYGYADQDGEYDDWIELYNNTDNTINLSNVYMSDDFSDPQAWQFPTGTVIEPNSYLIVWADKDEDQDGLHAGIKLSSGGEDLLLTNNDGTFIDSLTFGEQSTNVAMARVPNGTGDFIFQQPTFNSTNDISAVTNIGNNNYVSVYPNPASDRLNVKFLENNKDFTFSVINSIGQKILVKGIDRNNGSIDISSLENGMYFLQIFSNSKLVGNAKFIVLK